MNGLTGCLQPEMDHGPDAQRGLVVYVIDRVPPRLAPLLILITLIWLSVVLPDSL
jgi:hypothetical protein